MGATLLTATRLLFALQAAGARLSGTVRDGDTGEPVVGALVRLTDLARSTTTDRLGAYAFAPVPAGPQHLDVRRIGYHRHAIHALVPGHGTLEINVTMRPLPQRMQPVDVRPGPELSSVGRPGEDQLAPERTLSATAIHYHPLLAEPDVFLAVGGGSLTIAPESPRGLHGLGGSSDQVAFFLNGIPTFSPYHAAGAFSAWNPDAIESVRFSLAGAATGGPDALSGSLSAETRAPQPVFQVHGGLTTTHARMTVDGPIGRTGAGFLLSLRTGFPGAVAPPREPSYVKGETNDVLLTIERPFNAGRVRLLAYDSENEFITSAVTGLVDPVPPGSPRHDFHWRGRSAGGEWRGDWLERPLTMRAWSASARSASRWHGADSGVALPIHLSTGRDDAGMSAQLGSLRPIGLQAAMWLRASHTRYTVRESDGQLRVRIDGETPVAVLDVSHGVELSRTSRATIALATYRGAGRWWFAPRLVSRSALSPAVTLGTSVTGAVQFTQSLQNPESVVGTIFPAELDAGAGTGGVPVARSVDGVASLEVRSPGGFEVRGVVWARRLKRLVLAAPVTGDPFVTDTFAIGSGSAGGIAVEAAIGGTRYAAVASYAWQHVRRSTADRVYIPAHGSRHTADAGFVYFPSPTFSARTALAVIGGRRGTTMLGALEWESCNLLDRGCEFGGSPRHDPAGAGETRLPPYVRFDVGVRKHWHARVSGRDTQVALHATLTNLLSRANILTFIRPNDGAPDQPLEMRPFAPLVVGVDWRF